MDIDAIIQELHRPFPLDVLQLRVGATNRDKTSGIALAYVGWWRGYLPVLNHYIGRRNVRIAVSGPKGDTIAHLSAFDGAVQAWSRGEEEAGDENQGTSSEIQAKRRVCAEGLGLGLYLYSMPKLWGNIEAQGRSFVFPSHVEEQLKRQMYAMLGLDQIEPLVINPPFAIFLPGTPAAAPVAQAAPPPAAAAPTRGAGPTRAPTEHAAPDPAKVAAARAAHAAGERRAGLRSASAGANAPEARADRPASERQLHRIAADLAAYERDEELRHVGAGIARVLGRPVDVRQMHDPDYVASLRLTSRQASALIDAIKGITAGLMARTA
jgi:hypothetical protein